jgi:hypothetical protein
MALIALHVLAMLHLAVIHRAMIHHLMIGPVHGAMIVLSRRWSGRRIVLMLWRGRGLRCRRLVLMLSRLLRLRLPMIMRLR